MGRSRRVILSFDLRPLRSPQVPRSADRWGSGCTAPKQQASAVVCPNRIFFLRVLAPLDRSEREAGTYRCWRCCGASGQQQRHLHAPENYVALSVCIPGVFAVQLGYDCIN